MKKLFGKLKNTSGESIGETLASLLIIVLGMMMLAGSIVSASKVNKQVKDANTAFSTSNLVSENGTDGKVKITTDSSSAEFSVKVYKTNDQNDYVYYEEIESSAAESGE